MLRLALLAEKFVGIPTACSFWTGVGTNYKHPLNFCRSCQDRNCSAGSSAAAELSAVLPEGASVVDGRVEFGTTDPTGLVHAVTGWAIERGVRLDDLSVQRPPLEDVFLGLAGETSDAPSERL